MRFTNNGLVLIFLFVGIVAYGQKEIYERKNFDALTQDHAVLAIIPFVANLDLNDFDKKEVEALAKREGHAVQDALETYFSRRKKRKKFNVEFQNVDDTNALLAKNNIDYQNLAIYTTKELSELLGVDGIISGSIDLTILLSKGVPTNFSLLDYFTETNYGRIGVKISDGATGKLLWKYEKTITKKTGKDTEDVIDKMMKLASRSFPYDREKKKRRKK